MARYSQQLLKTIIQSYPIQERVNWTVGQISRAFRQYKLGFWHEVTLLYDQLFEDDTLPGLLEDRVRATTKSEFCLKPYAGSDKLNRRDQNTEDMFCEIAPDDELEEFLSHQIMLGVGLATLDWDTTGPMWIPKLRVLDTNYLHYDQYRMCWFYESRQGIMEVTPGDGKWVLMTNGETGWRHGLIRSVGQLWLQKQLTYCDWNRYNVKHGLPMVKARMPISVDAGEKDRFIDDLENLQSEGIIGLPQDENGKGYDVELMEAKDNNWQSFQASIERSDRKYAVALLGGNLGSEVASTGANRAAAETHASGVDRKKAKSDAKHLSNCLREQVLKPFYSLNFGALAAENVPFPYWDTCPEQDARAWADAQDKLADMLVKFKTAGIEVSNLDELASEYGLKLKQKIEEPLKPASQAGATGATGATDSGTPPGATSTEQNPLVK